MSDGRQRVTIERMKPCHIEAAAELERETFSQPWSADSLSAELANPLSFFLVALWDQQIVGYVGMTQVLDEGYMANLAVRAPFRRHGVATALMEELLAHAQEDELSFVTLEVRRSNRAAISLYEKLGFHEEGERRDFYTAPLEDGVIMTKWF